MEIKFKMNLHAIRDGLYHVETGLPWELFRPFELKTFGLEYGQHARRAALDDRFGQLTSVPLTCSFNRTSVFEVEVEQGRIVKFAARLSSGFAVSTKWSSRDDTLDLILVLNPSLHDSNNLFVKTLWLCERDDNHSTLNKSKYIPYNPWIQTKHAQS